MASRISAFLTELRRRKVYHVGAAYAAAGSTVVVAAHFLLVEVLDLENLAVQVILILVVLGFPIALVLAWAYELRPDQATEEPATSSSAEHASADVSAETSGGRLSIPTGAEREIRPTIAVLPFVDFSPNPDDAYFAGGIHEEILTQLQKVGGLAVRARTSVLRYREAPKPLPEIAKELGVQYIVEGSARKAGDQVRLTAQLMDAVKDEHIWAENYDRPLSMQNLIAVQAEIARQVAAELKGALSVSGVRPPSPRPTDSLKAYEEYLRGKHFVQRYTRSGFLKGIDHFQRAIDLDEHFADAWVGLGYCFKEMSELSYMDPAEGQPKAKDAVNRALELDESSGEAVAILASMKFVSEWDMEGPEALFRRAAELGPDTAEVFTLFGSYLTWLGRAEESIEMLRRGVDLDPLKPMANTWLGCAYFYANRYRESIDVHERLLEIAPNWLWSNIYLSHNYSAMGQHDKALAHAGKIESVAEATGDDYILSYVGGTYAWAGEEVRAREILRNAIELYGKGSLDAVSVAVILAQLGEKDEAFAWLHRGVDDRTGVSVYLKIYGRTFLRDLKPDPRFDEILRKVGFKA